MRSAWQKQQQVSYCFTEASGIWWWTSSTILLTPSTASDKYCSCKDKERGMGALHRQCLPPDEQRNQRTASRTTVRHREMPFVVFATVVLFHLERYVWKVTDEIIEIRTRQLIDTNMPMFMNDTENLTAAQTAMLRAVADGEYRFNSIPVVRKYELGSAQTITRNKRMLTERDFIEKEGNKYVSPIRYSSFGSGGSIAEYKKERGTACYPSSLKALRNPLYNEQTADPRRNQRRSSPCHSCIVSKFLRFSKTRMKHNASYNIISQNIEAKDTSLLRWQI